MTISDAVQEVLELIDFEKAKEKKLTPREIEVLGLYAQGYIDKQIGDELKISTQMVKNYASNYRQKLEARNTKHAIFIATLEGILKREVEEIELRLTPRETEVLWYIAQGCTGKEFYEILGIENQTVKNHTYSALHKNGDITTAALIYYATAQGILTKEKPATLQ